MPDRLDFGPFLSLGAEDRAWLSGRGSTVKLRRGAAVVRRGEEPDSCYAVLRGRLRVVAGDGTVLSTLAAPALVGELAVLDGRPRVADVVAVERVTALRIAAEDLRALSAAHPDFAEAIGSFADARRVSTFLHGQGPFAGLPSDEIDLLAARMRPRRIVPGEVLVRQGERGDDVLLLRSGEVDVVRTDGARETPVARLGPGSLVGEIGVLTGALRTATVRAHGDVDALVISGEDVRAVVKRHRALLDRVSSMMQARHTPRRTGEHRLAPAPDDPAATMLHDPTRGVYLRLDPQALAIYRDLDGERTIRDLAMRHFERTGQLDPHAVFSTVALLQASGFATAPRVASDEPNARLMRVADAILAPRAEIADVDPLVTRAHALLRPLLTRAAALAALAVGGVGVLAALPGLGAASPLTFGALGIVVAFAGLLLAGIGHEAAHALAAKAEGVRLGRAGIGLFWFAPVVYVDTSATWAIPRQARIRVNLAGPLFNFALAGLCGLLAAALGGATHDLLIWIAIANLVLVVFNLSPLLEFDGYYVLADLTDTNALRRKALRFVFREMIDRRSPPATRREAGFLLYTAAAFVYVLVMSAVVIAGLPGLVRDVLAPIFGAASATIGLGLALVLTVLLLAPFMLEALEARAHGEAAMGAP